MARRVNTKFVIILSVCLVAIGVGLGGIWYLASIRSAASDLMKADEAYAAGEFEDAALLYAKTISHRDYADNVELILKASHVNNLVPVTDARNARKHLGLTLAWLRRALRVNPQETEALDRLMKLQVTLAREMQDASLWDQIFNETQELLQAHEHLPLARKYRAVSQVNRVASASSIRLTDEDRAQIDEDLQAAFDADPDNAETLRTMALWYALEAKRLDTLGGDVQRAGELREKATSLTGTPLEKHAEDPQRLADHILMLMKLERPQEAESYLQRLEKILLEKPARGPLTAEVVQLIVSQHLAAIPDEQDKRVEPETMKRAVALVRKALEAHPDSTRLKFIMGVLLRDSNEREEATKMFEAAFTADMVALPFDFILNRNFKLISGISYLNLKAAAIGRITDVQERGKVLDEMERQLTNIKDEIGERKEIKKLEGNIASARGDYLQAIKDLGEAIERGDESLQTQYGAAVAALQVGEPGRATELFEKILRTWPALTPIRKTTAQVYLSSRQLDKAEKHIDILEVERADADKEPEPDPVINRLRLELLVRQERFDDAGALLANTPLEDNPRYVMVLASLYHAADRTETATGLLEKAFEEDPSNLRVLNMLIGIVEDKDKKLAYIDRSREAGAEDENLDRLSHFIKGEIDMQGELDGLIKKNIENQADQVVQGIQWYVYYMRKREPERAREELAKVRDLDPNHAALINTLFEDALLRRDYVDAEVVADRARNAKNGRGADMAKGAFYRGRLRMAKGEIDQAALAFRDGLQIRKVYSRGWEMLGSALLRMQEYTPAMEAFQTALKQRPTSLAALRGLATSHHNLGAKDKALEQLRLAHEYQPKNYGITDMYLQYELENGDAERALALREKVAAEDPDNHINRRAMAITLSRLKRFKEANQVLDALEEEQKEAEDEDQARLKRANVVARAQILQDGDDVEAATKLLKKHIQSGGADLTLEDYVVVARLLRNMERENDAVTLYRQAVRLEPDRDAVARELAELLMKQPDGSSEAVKLYQQIWESDTENAAATIDYIRALLSDKQTDDAVALVDSFEQKHGISVQTLILRAQLAALAGKIDEAEMSIEAAIERRPRLAHLHLVRAELLATDPARIGNAIGALDRALELDPLLTRARHMRARIHRARGEMTAAIRQYELLLDQDSNIFDARVELAGLYDSTAQTRDLKTHLDASAELFPDKAIWPRQQAHLLRSENKLIEAIEKMEHALKLEESDNLLFDLVTMMLQAQKPDSALKVLDKHKQIVADTPVLVALKGHAVMKTEGRKDALKVFSESLKKCDTHWKFVGVRNQLLRALDPSSTAELITAAFDEPLPIYVQLGLAELESRTSDYEATIARLQPLADQMPQRPRDEQGYYYHAYAIALHQTQKYEQAADAYRKLLELQPNNWVIMNNLAYLLVDNLKKPAEAADVADRAAKLRPDDPQILDTLGLVLHHNLELDRAREALEQSVKLKPQTATILHLVDVMYDMGRTDRVEELLEDATKRATRENDKDALDQVEQRKKKLNELLGTE